MKLGAYKINNTPVSQLHSVNVADLQGKAPYVLSDKLPRGYKDISSIENLHLYGRGLIGNAPGLMDWKCLQREIKQLVMARVKDDLTGNWDKLSHSEKLVTCHYLLGKIPPEVFSALVSDAAERAKISAEYDLNNRQARGSWSGNGGRLQAVKQHLFARLGKAQAMEVIADILKDGLFQLYEGGIEGSEEDGIVGINDFLLARKKTPYATTGLKKRKYKLVDGSEDSVKEVADQLVTIISNGNY